MSDHSADTDETSDTEPMRTEKVLETLGHALTLQARSLVTMTVLAGSLRGLDGMGAKFRLRQLVQHELEDTYLLVEKFVALGGEPDLQPGRVSPRSDPARALQDLVAHEREVVAALHAVIPYSGQEPRSEALEHLLEHVIMRKQQQVDLLTLAVEEG
jgi:bacterioferritin (cytochrome b1)